MRIFQYLFILVIILLSACGGSGGDSATIADANINTTPPAYSWVPGIYTGTFTDSSDPQNPATTRILITSDGHFTLVRTDVSQIQPTDYAIGTVSGAVITSDQGDFVATMDSASGGTFTSTTSGTFTLTDTGLYDRAPTIGPATWNDDSDAPTVFTSVISDTGDFTLSITNSTCTGNGSITPIDPDKNEFHYSMLMQNCNSSNLDGNYTGFATTDDAMTFPDWQLHIVSENSAQAIYLILDPVRQ